MTGWKWESKGGYVNEENGMEADAVTGGGDVHGGVYDACGGEGRRFNEWN